MATGQKARGSNPSRRAKKLVKSKDFGAVVAFLGIFRGALICADPYRDPYGNGVGKGSESSGEKGTYLFYASKFYISVLM